MYMIIKEYLVQEIELLRLDEYGAVSGMETSGVKSHVQNIVKNEFGRRRTQLTFMLNDVLNIERTLDETRPSSNDQLNNIRDLLYNALYITRDVLQDDHDLSKAIKDAYDIARFLALPEKEDKS